jgi:hypothetical protein
VLRGLSLVLMTTLMVIACTKRSPPDFTAPHRATWDASGVSSYAYEIVYYGAVPDAPPMRTVVTNDAVESATLICRPPLTQASCDAWLEMRKDQYGPDKLIGHARTIPQLFDRMIAVRSDPFDRDAKIHAEFDPTHGYPLRFSFDNPASDDDEFAFEVSDFKIIQ